MERPDVQNHSRRRNVFSHLHGGDEFLCPSIHRRKGRRGKHCAEAGHPVPGEWVEE